MKYKNYFKCENTKKLLNLIQDFVDFNIDRTKTSETNIAQL